MSYKKIVESHQDNIYHALFLFKANKYFSLVYDVFTDQIDIANFFKYQKNFLFDSCPKGFIGGHQPSRALALTGSPFLINTYTSGNQTNPRVALLSNGFMVLWISYNGLFLRNVFLQSIDGVGSKRGSETPVNTIYLFNKDLPTIASIMTWCSLVDTWTPAKFHFLPRRHCQNSCIYCWLLRSG